MSHRALDRQHERAMRAPYAHPCHAASWLHLRNMSRCLALVDLPSPSFNWHQEAQASLPPSRSGSGWASLLEALLETDPACRLAPLEAIPLLLACEEADATHSSALQPPIPRERPSRAWQNAVVVVEFGSLRYRPVSALSTCIR